MISLNYFEYSVKDRDKNIKVDNDMRLKLLVGKPGKLKSLTGAVRGIYVDGRGLNICVYGSMDNMPEDFHTIKEEEILKLEVEATKPKPEELIPEEQKRYSVAYQYKTGREVIDHIQFMTYTEAAIWKNHIAKVYIPPYDETIEKLSVKIVKAS